MKISYLINNIYGIGGTIRTVINQAEELRRRHEVEIVSVFRHRDHPHLPISPDIALVGLVDLRRPTGKGSGARGKDVGTERANTPSLLFPSADKRSEQYSLLADDRLREYFATTDADVIVGTRPGLNVVLARLAPEHAVTVGQEHLSYGAHSTAMKRVIAEAYRDLDAFVTVTEADARQYRRNLDLPGVRLLAIPNSVSAPRITKGGGDPKTIVAAGRLESAKRYDLLIKAFARLLPRYPDWTLRIYGRGERMASLKALVASLGVGDNVFLMGSHTHIEEAWALGSIAAVTSRAEGFGMTIVEAMRAGLPVVSTDCPVGPREIIRHGEDGLLVTNGDVDAIAEGLDTLMGDDELRSRMSEAALGNSARFDPATVARRHEELFTELVGEERSVADERPKPPVTEPDDRSCAAVVDPQGVTHLRFPDAPEYVLLRKGENEEVRLWPDETGTVEVDPDNGSLSSGTWTVVRVDGGAESAVSASLIDLRAYPLDPAAVKRLSLTVPARAGGETCRIIVRRSPHHAELRTVELNEAGLTLRAAVLGHTAGASEARLRLRPSDSPEPCVDTPCRIEADGHVRATVPLYRLTEGRGDAKTVWEATLHGDDGTSYSIGRSLDGVVERRSVTSYPETTVPGTEWGDVRVSVGYTDLDQLMVEMNALGTDARVVEALGDVTATTEITSVEWHGSEVRVDIDARPTTLSGAPLAQRRTEGRLRWVVAGGKAVGPDVAGLPIDAELALRPPDDPGNEVPLRTGVAAFDDAAERPGDVHPRLRATAHVDLLGSGKKSPFSEGRWEFVLRLRCYGVRVETVVAPSPSARRRWPAFYGPAATFAEVIEARHPERLAIDVGGSLTSLSHAVRAPRTAEVTESAGELELSVPLAVSLSDRVELELELVTSTGTAARLPATLAPEEHGAVLRARIGRADVERIDAALLHIRRDGDEESLETVLGRTDEGRWRLVRLFPEDPGVAEVEWEAGVLRVHGSLPQPPRLVGGVEPAVLLRRRGDGRWLRFPVERRDEERFTVDLTLVSALADGRLENGVWDVSVALSVAGVTSERRVRLPEAGADGPEPCVGIVDTAVRAALVTAHRPSGEDSLSLEVGEVECALPSALEVLSTRWDAGGVLRIDARSALPAAPRFDVFLRATADDGSVVDTPASRVAADDASADFRVVLRPRRFPTPGKGGTHSWRLDWLLVEEGGDRRLARSPFRTAEPVAPSRWVTGTGFRAARIPVRAERANSMIVERFDVATAVGRRVRRLLGKP